METRSRSKVKGKTSPPRAATVGGTQPVRDVFVDPPSSADGLTGNGRISPRSSSLEAGPRRTCCLTAGSESAIGTRGPAQEVKNDENCVIVDSQSSEKVLIPTPDEGWNSTLVIKMSTFYEVSRPFVLFKCGTINRRVPSSVAGQPQLPWQAFYALVVESGYPISPPKYEVDMTALYLAVS